MFYSVLAFLDGAFDVSMGITSIVWRSVVIAMSLALYLRFLAQIELLLEDADSANLDGHVGICSILF